jgi:hypothetical protein
MKIKHVEWAERWGSHRHPGSLRCGVRKTGVSSEKRRYEISSKQVAMSVGIGSGMEPNRQV